MSPEAIHHFWELLWGMTEKELRSRYKHTIFGFLWLVANPLLQMLVIGIIFPLIIRVPIQHYFYYLFTGLLAWNFFSLSLTKSTPSIVFERNLIKKSAFPRAVIPLSIILSNLVHYLVAFILFLFPLMFLGNVSIAAILPVAAGLLLLLTFTVGTSLLTSALNVRYRDINFLTQALLIIWFYATPIVYALSQIPSSLRWVWSVNPLTAPIQLLQHALVGSPPPETGIVLYNALITVFVCLAGLWIFHRESRTFDDWL